VIDTHCHMTFPDFESPRMPGGVASVLERARANGVSGLISISTTTTDARKALAIAKQFDRVWCSAGVHPLYSDQGPHNWAELEEVARDPKCVAFGELGLDNHYKDPAATLQRTVLEEQLGVISNLHSQGVRKPLIIHCRDAFDDTISILQASGIDPTRMVFHCFTGTADNARAVLNFGAFISFTGVVTYKNAANVREAVALMPQNRFMVETDAPFLSPEPHRSTRPCEPWMTRLTLEAIATIRNEPFDTLHHAINTTTSNFFGIDAR